MHIPAQPEAPIACDMTGAPDTPDKRVREYARLFERALLQRERRHHAVVFRFRPAAREAVEDLARREAACCPFLDYRVESAGDEVVWTTSGSRPGVDAILDAFHALPDLPVTALPAVSGWLPAAGT